MRMTSRSMSVDWMRTMSSKCATSVAMVLLPVPTAPQIINTSGRELRWNSDQTR